MGTIKAIKGLGKAFLDAATSKQMKKIPGGKFISFPAEILKKKKAGLAVGAGAAVATDAAMEKDKFKKAMDIEYNKAKKARETRQLKDKKNRKDKKNDR